MLGDVPDRTYIFNKIDEYEIYSHGNKKKMSSGNMCLFLKYHVSI